MKSEPSVVGTFLLDPSLRNANMLRSLLLLSYQDSTLIYKSNKYNLNLDKTYTTCGHPDLWE